MLPGAGSSLGLALYLASRKSRYQTSTITAGIAPPLPQTQPSAPSALAGARHHVKPTNPNHLTSSIARLLTPGRFLSAQHMHSNASRRSAAGSGASFPYVAALEVVQLQELPRTARSVTVLLYSARQAALTAGGTFPCYMPAWRGKGPWSVLKLPFQIQLNTLCWFSLQTTSPRQDHRLCIQAAYRSHKLLDR